jgi:GNAT superfamily N-acetyltransferase
MEGIKPLSFSISTSKLPNKKELFELYKANKWSSANKIDALHKAMVHSETVVTVYLDNRLVGLANAISDQSLVVYFPHLLVHPLYQKMGLGGQLIDVMLEKYRGFHQQMLVADDAAVSFYKKKGFRKAVNTTSMWIYENVDS